MHVAHDLLDLQQPHCAQRRSRLKPGETCESSAGISAGGIDELVHVRPQDIRDLEVGSGGMGGHYDIPGSGRVIENVPANDCRHRQRLQMPIQK
jgi:hypothetical protein